MSSDEVTELPRAYVVLRDSVEEEKAVSSKDIYDFTRQRLARYKKLDGGVIFVKAIPRTPSGKIQRFKLLQTDDKTHLSSSFLSSLFHMFKRSGSLSRLLNNLTRLLSVAKDYIQSRL
jgi:hypothetical protein